MGMRKRRSHVTMKPSLLPLVIQLCSGLMQNVFNIPETAQTSTLTTEALQIFEPRYLPYRRSLWSFHTWPGVRKSQPAMTPCEVAKATMFWEPNTERSGQCNRKPRSLTGRYGRVPNRTVPYLGRSIHIHHNSVPSWVDKAFQFRGTLGYIRLQPANPECSKIMTQKYPNILFGEELVFLA